MTQQICRAGFTRFAILVAGLIWATPEARSDTTPWSAFVPPGQLCRQAIALAERATHTPPYLLAAIGRVESGRRDPQSGSVDPWPWSINVEGEDHVYDSKAQAIAAVRAFQAAGARSIDVGCMQINLLHHPDAFASLEQAFDPQINAAYGARFLTELFQQTGSWEKATAWYHSATPGLGESYQQRVAAAMPAEQHIAPVLPMLRFGGSIGSPVLPHMDRPRIIPMQGAGGGLMTGRTLDSYRALPMRLASQH